MTEPDLLTPLLRASGSEAGDLGAEEIAALGALFGFDAEDPLTDEIADAVARLGRDQWTGDEHPPGTYAFRVGRWRISLGNDNGLKAGILSAAIAATLIDQGLSKIGVAVTAAVLPNVLTISDVELSPHDQRLLIELRLKPAVADGYMTQDELYDALPEEYRRTLNRADFAEFIEHLRHASLLQEDDGWMRPMDPDDQRPVISWK